MLIPFHLLAPPTFSHLDSYWSPCFQFPSSGISPPHSCLRDHSKMPIWSWSFAWLKYLHFPLNTSRIKPKVLNISHKIQPQIISLPSPTWIHLKPLRAISHPHDFAKAIPLAWHIPPHLVPLVWQIPIHPSRTSTNKSCSVKLPLAFPSPLMPPVPPLTPSLCQSICCMSYNLVWHAGFPH